MLTVGSLFSGIEGFGLGFTRAGAEVAWHVEIDQDCQRVIRSHFRSAERNEQGKSDTGGLGAPSQHAPRGGPVGDPVIHSDVLNVGRNNLPPVDLVCGGFPCQDLSMAGNRAGLAGERSGLWYEFRRVVGELHPEWVVVENVGGLLSSQSGRDLAIILRGLAELGYWWAYRVFDAQYFGVAQRRERVFIVGHSRDRTYPAKVLFEPESCSGDSPPRRQARQDLAGTLGGGSGERGWAPDTDRMTFIPEVAPMLGGGNYGQGNLDEGVPSVVSVRTAQTSSNGWGINQEGTAYTLDGAQGQAVAETLRSHPRPGSNSLGALATSVRRLTPTECERLQGFPDGWTEGLSDSARYRVLGNAVCVPVAKWAARRIVTLHNGEAA